MTDQEAIIGRLKDLVLLELPTRFLKYDRKYYAEQLPNDVTVVWKVPTTFPNVSMQLFMDQEPTITCSSGPYEAAQTLLLAEMMLEASRFAMAFELIRKEYRGD